MTISIHRREEQRQQIKQKLWENKQSLRYIPDFKSYNNMR